MACITLTLDINKLPVKTFKTICQTHEEYNDNNIWGIFLLRDFNAVSDDAKNKYHLYKKTLNKLSRYYKYIMLNALKAFIDYIGFDYWEDCKAYFQDWEGYNDLFSYKELKRLINYVREDTENKKHPFVLYDLKQNFKNDVMKDILNYDNAVESIKLNNSLNKFTMILIYMMF